jgi:hypothetical protein
MAQSIHSDLLQFYKTKKVISTYDHPSFPSKESLLKMIMKEQEIRTSSEYIQRCDDVADKPNGWLDVSEQVQYDVVKMFGYKDGFDADIAVNHLRRAQYLYPEEPLFQTIPIYVKNNLANIGKFKLGDIIPNLTIYNINLDPIPLYSIFEKDRKNILFASSHT